MKKKLLSVLLTAAISLGVANTALAAENKNITATYRGIGLYINTIPIALYSADGTYIEPFICEGTTYLPLRAVAEAFGMEVGWDESTYTITLTASTLPSGFGEVPVDKKYATEELNVTYNNISVYVNGKQLDLINADGVEVEPFISNGTTYLPVRNVAEAVGADVSWDDATNSVNMSISLGGLLDEYEELPPLELPEYDVTAATDMTTAQAEKYGFTVDFTKYSNYATIVDYNGEEDDVLIPAKINGKTTYILPYETNQPHPFANKDNIVTITFEDGASVRHYNSMFYFCTGLRAVINMPNGTNGNNCFSGCKRLELVTSFANDISGMDSFYNLNRRMTTVHAPIGHRITSMNSTFAYCNSLTGEITVLSPIVKSASGCFTGTRKPITLKVPANSITYDTFAASNLPSNVTLTTYDTELIYLPEVINIAAGVDATIYNKNVSRMSSVYTTKWICDIGSENSNGYNIYPKATELGEYPLTVELYRPDGTLACSKSTTLNIVPSKISSSVSMLTIGNELSLDDSWFMRLTGRSNLIKFCGTQKSKHESRYGWTSDSFLASKSSPFYNSATGSFDWASYKSENSIKPTCVNIFLSALPGDDSQVQNAENIKAMVENIRSTDPELPIYVCVTPNINTGATLSTTTFNMGVALNDALSGIENVEIIPLNLFYDHDTMKDSAKTWLPGSNGNLVIADIIYSTLAAAQN